MDPLASAPTPKGTLGNLAVALLMSVLGGWVWLRSGERSLMGASCVSLFGMCVAIFAHQLWGARPGRVGALARWGLRAGPWVGLGVLCSPLFGGEGVARAAHCAFAALVGALLLFVGLLLPLRAGLFARGGRRVVLAREGVLTLAPRGATLVPFGALREVERARYWLVPAVGLGLKPEGFGQQQRFVRRGAPPGELALYEREELARRPAVLSTTGADALVWAYQSALGVGDFHSELRAALEHVELRRDWPTARSLVRAHFGEGAPAGAGPYRRGGDE